MATVTSVELSSWFGRKKVSKVRLSFPASDPFGLPCWPSGNLFFSILKLSSYERTLTHERTPLVFLFIAFKAKKKKASFETELLWSRLGFCAGICPPPPPSSLPSPLGAPPVPSVPPCHLANLKHSFGGGRWRRKLHPANTSCLPDTFHHQRMRDEFQDFSLVWEEKFSLFFSV